MAKIILSSSIVYFNIVGLLGQNLNDEQQIKNYLKKLNSKEEDENIDEYEKVYDDGEVIYSPDSLFKIFKLTGYEYEVYFTPISNSYIHFINKKKETLKTINISSFSAVKDIYKLSENNTTCDYLLLENDGDGTTFYWMYAISASWISINKASHKIVFNSIDIEVEKNQLTYHTAPAYEGMRNANISYNEKTQILKFEYDIDNNIEKDERDIKSTHFMRIMYEWKNGVFILIREEKVAYE